MGSVNGSGRRKKPRRETSEKERPGQQLHFNGREPDPPGFLLGAASFGPYPHQATAHHTTLRLAKRTEAFWSLGRARRLAILGLSRTPAKHIRQGAMVWVGRKALSGLVWALHARICMQSAVLSGALFELHVRSRVDGCSTDRTTDRSPLSGDSRSGTGRGDDRRLLLHS